MKAVCEFTGCRHFLGRQWMYIQHPQHCLLNFVVYSITVAPWTLYCHWLSTCVKWLASEYTVRLIHNNEQEDPGTLTMSYTQSVSSPDVGIFWVDSECTFNLCNSLCLTFLVYDELVAPWRSYCHWLSTCVNWLASEHTVRLLFAFDPQ